jgi:hypothetical protein
MIEIEIGFLVQKRIDHVFRRISDIANYWRWVPERSKFFIENKVTSEGPFGVGTTYVDRLKWWGKAVGEVIVYEPPSSIKFKQKTSFGLPVFSATAEYNLNPHQHSTEVEHRFQVIPCGLFNLFQPILAKIVRSERERTCRAIEQGLDQEVGRHG